MQKISSLATVSFNTPNVSINSQSPTGSMSPSRETYLRDAMFGPGSLPSCYFSPACSPEFSRGAPMDPTIMKLLEDDEDESMHSGADVEAFTAALNRDIGGDAPSAPPPSDAEAGALSQGSNSASQQLVGQWQTSNQEENIAQQALRQEEKQLLSDPEQPSQMEPIQPESVSENKDLSAASQTEHAQLLMQEEQSHSSQQQRQNETHSLQSTEKNKASVSEQNPAQGPTQDNVQHSEGQQQHTLPESNSQQVPAINQANNAIRHMKVTPTIPFQMLIPILRPHLDKDRSMQLQSVYAKLRNNEVSKEDFLRVIRNIVGDQMLRQAAHKVQMQLHTQAARNQQMNANQYSLQAQVSSQQLSTRSSQHTTESQAFPALHSVSSSQNDKGPPPHQPHVPLSTGQTQTETSFTTLSSVSHKSREVESKSDGKGLHAVQIPSTNLNAIHPEREIPTNSFQAIGKQQQHTQLPPTSFSMYGSTTNNPPAHSYPRPCMTGITNAFKPQPQDSQMRQSPLSPGTVSTQLGANQSKNIVNVTKYEHQTTVNETKRPHGGTLTHLASHSSVQQNSIAWQPSANKEQGSNALSSVAFVKQEVVDQSAESQNKSQFTATEGSSFGSVHVNKGNSTPQSLKDENTEKQSSRMAFASSGMMTASKISGPVAMQVELTVQSRPQILSATPPSLAGATTKTPQKKPSVGQKKSLETLGASPPPASKKQKTSGAFLDQSIEQLNDVTAVSGVNLREEEEQLLSAPKEDSRALEATRRVVQEEEEKLILQKGPLQRKLKDIMFNCGIESMSSDVERCLSMCVEERLRGLISNLIRLSKQRVDIEKTRHRFVITSDVRRHIMLMNQKAKEEWEKKQAEEAEKLRKLNQTEGNTGAEAEKEKDESRSKAPKVNKEEDDKMRTTAANVAARAAVGGDDMLSKWQLMAEQARQKREGLDGASGSQPGKMTSSKPLPNLGRHLRENQEPGKKGPSAASTSGSMRKLGRAPGAASHPKIARNISIKDVIAVLEREPQMSKSTLTYCLYERTRGDSASRSS